MVQRYGDDFNRLLERRLSEETLSPLSRVEFFMQGAAAWMSQHDFRHGCLIGNLGQEVGQLPETLREPLQQILAGWEQRIAGCLQLAIDSGEIGSQKSAEWLAHVFWSGWEGAVMRARIERSAAPLESFRQWFVDSLRVSAPIRAEKAGE